MLSHNPFSSRNIRPGSIPFLFPEDESVHTILDRWQKANYQGVILGPHGSGKSSLLARIQDTLTQQQKAAKLLVIQDRKSWNFNCFVNLQEDVILLDGVEQLSWWQRARVLQFCHRNSIKLLATSHESIGVSEIYRTSPSVELLKTLTTYLLENHLTSWAPSDAQLTQLFKEHPGNLRECLFQLYHLYESDHKHQLVGL